MITFPLYSVFCLRPQISTHLTGENGKESKPGA
ncbi:hypothetical protein T01_12318 [Trichinella spiralis]|uniref:Uncharacterized protein n=1 Tax=Trichinella spiralis TaxID=6334 RepID=A0A0V0YRJ5_TRISP|nr:hypothetical protein T01_12318 [Trichinella spiralis]